MSKVDISQYFGVGKSEADDIVTPEGHNVPIRLISSIVKHESAGDENAVSDKGAVGLMQMMPGTAKDVGVKNRFNPKENIEGGTRYFSRLVDKYDGDVKKALIAYNWGPSNLDKHGVEKAPKSTHNYADNIMTDAGIQSEKSADEIVAEHFTQDNHEKTADEIVAESLPTKLERKAAAVHTPIKKPHDAQSDKPTPSRLGEVWDELKGNIKQAKEESTNPANAAGEVAAGVAEPVMNAVSGAVATPIAGLAGLARTGGGLLFGEGLDEATKHGSDVIRDTQEALTYKPKTGAGKAVTNVVNAPMTLASGYSGDVGEKIGGYIGPKAEIAGREIGASIPAVAATLVGGRSAVKAGSIPSEKIPPKTTREDLNIKFQDAGFKLPPSTANPTYKNKLITAIGGKIANEQEASWENQRVSNRIVKKDIGLDEHDDILPETLDAALQKEYDGAYYKLSNAKFGTVKYTESPRHVTDWDTQGTEKTRDAGLIVTDRFIKRVDDLVNKTAELKEQYPELVQGKALKKEADRLKQEHDPRLAFKLIQELRNQASTNLSGMDIPYARKRLGRFQKGAADALEQLFEDRLIELKQPGLVDDYRNSRERIAKIYSVKRALNETTGDIDAHNLGRQLKSGVPLTGGLRLVAEFARTHEKLVQRPSRIDTPQGLTTLGVGLGVAESGAAIAAGKPKLAAAGLGATLGRPLVRQYGLSDAYQKGGAHAQRYTFGKRRKEVLKKSVPVAYAAETEADK